MQYICLRASYCLLFWSRVQSWFGFPLHNRMEDPSAERQIADRYLTKGDTGRRKLSAIFAGNGDRATTFRVFNYQF
jgi:hypothetical protein